MKGLHKVYNLFVFFFPIIITLIFSSHDVILVSNDTLYDLDTHVCESINEEAIFANKNFIVSFLFMITPLFLGLTLPDFLHCLELKYSTIETLFLNIVLIYKTTTAIIYFGYASYFGQKLERSSNICLLLFILCKTQSKILSTKCGKIVFFWSVFIVISVLYDPFLLNFPLDEGHLLSLIVISTSLIECAYAKWVERGHSPNGFMLCSIILFLSAMICIQVGAVVCNPYSRFQWLPCGRALAAVAVFPYFVGYRKQEQVQLQLVQNRFSEVSTQDDDQLI